MKFSRLFRSQSSVQDFKKCNAVVRVQGTAQPLPSQALVLGVEDSGLGVRTEVTAAAESPDCSSHPSCAKRTTTQSVALARVSKARCHEHKLLTISYKINAALQMVVWLAFIVFGEELGLML